MQCFSVTHMVYQALDDMCGHVCTLPVKAMFIHFWLYCVMVAYLMWVMCCLCSFICGINQCCVSVLLWADGNIVCRYGRMSSGVERWNMWAWCQNWTICHRLSSCCMKTQPRTLVLRRGSVKFIICIIILLLKIDVK